jgi:magnesium and cobalt transporter
VKALTPIDEFNDMFNTDFSDEEVDTIGGMVMTSFGHLPSRGETIAIENYHFKVTSADNRRIIQLQVTIPEEDTSSNVEE